MLDNDIRSYRNAADFEEAVDAAASIGSAIVRAGLPVALRSTGADIGVGFCGSRILRGCSTRWPCGGPRVLKVPPPALRRVPAGHQVDVIFPGDRPVHRPDPSAIAALGLVE